MSVLAPTRSHDQRLDALRRANEIRVLRAALKRSIQSRHEAVELILNPPWFIETMKAFDLLFAVPKVGRVKAARLLNQCRISQSKTVGGLSARQRNDLSEAVRS